MLHRKSSPGQGSSPGARCDHRACTIAVAATELGYHARCLRCGALGPGQPSSKSARLVLLVKGSEPAYNDRYR
jgi:hypothetical protein